MRVSDVELKEMAKLRGWPHDMAVELITARERGPVLEAEWHQMREENLNLKARLRSYVDMQVRVIDERRAIHAELESLRQALANRSA